VPFGLIRGWVKLRVRVVAERKKWGGKGEERLGNRKTRCKKWEDILSKKNGKKVVPHVAKKQDLKVRGK